ncbi:MAG: hypothetical protein Q9209_000701 [Squamulea sp. 1 TL-2023]
MSSPGYWSIVYVLLAPAVVQLCSAALPLSPSSTTPDCSCYQAAGNREAVFLNHQFFDFRSLDDETFASNLTAPPAIDDSQGRGIEPFTSPFFDTGFFGDYFTPASWTRNVSEAGRLPMVNSHQNVYLSERFALSPVPNLLKTNDPNGQVIPEAFSMITIPQSEGTATGSWTGWNDYQLNWLPGRSEWLINGISRLNKTYGVPTQPSNLQLRMWSDGSDWTGNMTVGGLATLDIEWIDLVYNSSREAPGATCKTVCSIDNFAQNLQPQAASGTVRILPLEALALLLCVFWATTLLW